MIGLNKLTIIGNLTRDPETRTTQDGKIVCGFTVAVNRRQKDPQGNSIADFFRISAWGKLGENCQKYLTKGKKVAVIGQVSVHAYLNKDNQAAATLEVFAEDVEFLSPVGDNGHVQAVEAPASDIQPNMTPVAIPDSELPF